MGSKAIAGFTLILVVMASFSLVQIGCPACGGSGLLSVSPGTVNVKLLNAKLLFVYCKGLVLYNITYGISSSVPLPTEIFLVLDTVNSTSGSSITKARWIEEIKGTGTFIRSRALEIETPKGEWTFNLRATATSGEGSREVVCAYCGGTGRVNLLMYTRWYVVRS